jgi:hypothetical protein
MPETQIYPEIPKPAAQEQAVEVQFEQRPAAAERPREIPLSAPTPIPPAPTHPGVQPLDTMPPQTSVLAQEVEHVLAEGLEETYEQLDPATQARFKIAGEETATKISVLLADVKDQTRKILELIVAWLRIIPGVNHYFLEQEAKIKADKLLRLRQPRV